MSKSKKLQPATVFAAKQAGEAQAQFPFGEENSRWTWVESSVWTDRMLTALENGVREGKWFSLMAAEPTCSISSRSGKSFRSPPLLPAHRARRRPPHGSRTRADERPQTPVRTADGDRICLALRRWPDARVQAANPPPTPKHKTSACGIWRVAIRTMSQQVGRCGLKLLRWM